MLAHAAEMGYAGDEPDCDIATDSDAGDASNADVVHDWVQEWASKAIGITVGWKGDKLPKCGMLRGSHAEATKSPKIPVRKVDLELRPYQDEDGSRRRSGLRKDRKVARHYGALRCAGTTHLRGPALY